jgi:uncharacterized damage-inducible protein DinB
MDKNSLSLLAAYNGWANERILSACERVSNEEFLRPVTPDPGWGSLRGILAHALDAEYGWRCLLQGQDASEILDEAAFADLAALKARWEIERAEWNHFMAGLDPQQLNAGYGDEPSSSPKAWQAILHVINHATHHRSEAAAILTAYGQSPGELDLDVFLDENPEYQLA